MTTVKVIHMRARGKQSHFVEEGHAYIYCGRPSKYGNPYAMKNNSDAERSRVIEEFRNDDEARAKSKGLAKWVADQGLHMVELGCYCAPKACHCDVIADDIRDECNNID